MNDFSSIIAGVLASIIILFFLISKLVFSIYKGNKEKIILKKVLVSVLLFVPLFLPYGFIALKDPFFNYDEASIIIEWYNNIAICVYLLLSISFTLLWVIKKLKYFIIIIIITIAVKINAESYLTDYFSTFTPNKWNKYSDCRYMMFKDLTKKYSLAGMERKDIIKLLGENEEIIHHKNNKNELTYVIHNRSVLRRTDIDYLIITFDDMNKVKIFELTNLNKYD